jgi:fatty acid desaturase
MFQTRRTPDTVFLKLLASLVALGLLACLSAAAWMGAGPLARSPFVLVVLVVATGALLLGVRRLMHELADRRAAEDLDASELTTLTFPPESRLQRPRSSQFR